MELLAIPDYYIKKGRPHGHRYGKKPGDREYCIAHFLKKKCKKKNYQGYLRSICTRWQIPQDYDWNWSNRRSLSPNGWSCGRRSYPPFDSKKLTHRNNWSIRSNKISSDTMPIRHRSDFKQALSTFRQLTEKEEEAQQRQRWTQSYSSSWWSWQGTLWTPYSYESHHGDGDVPSTNWSGKPDANK